MQVKPLIQGILFDLDGTLLDTAQDLVTSLQHLNEKTLTFNNAIRAAAGKGCKGLIKTGLNIGHEDSRYHELAQKLLSHYGNHLLDTTILFPGMEIVLDHLDKIQLPWGIVTNKPHQYTQPLLTGLKLIERTQCIISGDSLSKCKPHPEPLLHACTLLKIAPEHCLYVGDSEIDIIASKAAGISSLVALYGYIAENEDPHAWKADGYIKRPEEILDWL